MWQMKTFKNRHMKTNSIKFKIVVFLFIVIAIGTTLILNFINISYKKNIKLASEQAIEQTKNAFNNLAENDSRMMHATLTGLLSNEKMRDLFLKKDIDKLYGYTKPIFEDLKTKTGITHWYFIEAEPEKKCFLRVHNKEKNGDIITRFTYEAAVKTKELSYGIELGKTAFALRTVHPYLHNDSIIGYMELGEEIEHFFEIMKKQTGDDYGLLVKKEFLDEKKWESVCKTKNIENNWDKLPTTLLIENTSHNDEIIEFTADVENIDDKGMVINEIEKDGKTLVHGIIPLYDAGNRKTGGVFVLHDVTHLYAEMNATKTKVIFSVIAIMIAAIFIIFFILDRLVFKRLKALVTVATRVVGGDYNAKVNSNSNDEIGEFETLFEQFRQVFVNLMAEYKWLVENKD
ncbi:MAG: hypothetical protein B6I20_03405 [Bacteroidetes bacterium 4572_117]|nr:MAG: hypothetical protein B6I20_03405 [Bacteroidetes bacterium 4572_117]